MSPEHAVVYRFRVPEERRDDFERAYGPEGDWVALFRAAEGYVGTMLLRSPDGSGAYLTIDRWRSREAYERFLRDFAAAYEALDHELEGIAAEETRLGSFEAIADG